MERVNPILEKPESCVAFRIMGTDLDLDGISTALGIRPTHVHRAGEFGPLRQSYAQDMWMLSSPLSPTEALEAHVIWFGKILWPHFEFLSKLHNTAKLDFYCSFSCFSEQNAITLSAEALKLFVGLGVPLGISILAILPDEAFEEQEQAGGPPNVGPE